MSTPALLSANPNPFAEAMALGLRVADIRAPGQIFAETIAPVADRATERAVSRAPSKADALALVFASPAFQRR